MFRPLSSWRQRGAEHPDGPLIDQEIPVRRDEPEAGNGPREWALINGWRTGPNPASAQTFVAVESQAMDAADGHRA